MRTLGSQIDDHHTSQEITTGYVQCITDARRIFFILPHHVHEYTPTFFAAYLV